MLIDVYICTTRRMILYMCAPIDATAEAGDFIKARHNIISGICPAHYHPHSLSDIRAGATPYFLGGRVGLKPKDEPNWKAFCAGEGFGAVCPLQTPGKTVESLVGLLLSAGE